MIWVSVAVRVSFLDCTGSAVRVFTQYFYFPPNIYHFKRDTRQAPFQNKNTGCGRVWSYCAFYLLLLLFGSWWKLLLDGKCVVCFSGWVYVGDVVLCSLWFGTDALG